MKLEETVLAHEITAIPEVLKMIDVKEATVPIDAMGCQTEMAKQMIRQGADYVLSLKENQPTLYQNACSIFALAERGEKRYKKKYSPPINHLKHHHQ